MHNTGLSHGDLLRHLLRVARRSREASLELHCGFGPMIEFRLLQFALIFALGLLLRWIYTLVTGNPPQSYFVWGLLALGAVGALELIKAAIADIAGYYLQRVHLWEVATGKLIRKLPGFGRNVLSLCFFPDGKTLAAGRNAKTGFWEVATGRRVRKLKGYFNASSA